MSDWNQKIIEEFRANDGRVGGPFDGVPILLLHHRGARTGTERVSPLAYRRVGEDYVVFGSKGGAPDNPAWVHNLAAHADTTIEVGTDTVEVTARRTEGDERERIWSDQKRDAPVFAGYEEKTTREIPVIVLTPKAG